MSPVSEKDAMSQNAYMLFYKKCQSSTSNDPIQPIIKQIKTLNSTQSTIVTNGSNKHPEEKLISKLNGKAHENGHNGVDKEHLQNGDIKLELNGSGSIENGNNLNHNGHSSLQNGHASNINGHTSNMNGHIQNGHGSDLNGHSAIQNGHSSHLNGHSSNMNGHTSEINGHSSSINGHSSEMNGHEASQENKPLKKTIKQKLRKNKELILKCAKKLKKKDLRKIDSKILRKLLKKSNETAKSDEEIKPSKSKKLRKRKVQRLKRLLKRNEKLRSLKKAKLIRKRELKARNVVEKEPSLPVTINESEQSEKKMPNDAQGSILSTLIDTASTNALSTWNNEKSTLFSNGKHKLSDTDDELDEYNEDFDKPVDFFSLL